MRDLFRLLKLAFQQKKFLFLSFGSSIFVALFTYLFVDLVQPVLDRMFLRTPASAMPEKPRLIDSVFALLRVTEDDLIRVLPLLVLVVIFGKGLFTFLSAYFMKNVGLRVVQTMRNDAYTSLIHQSASYFDSRSTGDMMSRMTDDVEKVREALSGAVGDLMEEAFILTALLIGIFLRDFRLALVSLIVAPLAAVPLAVFSRQLKKKGLAAQVRMSAIYSQLHETLTGHRVVKAFSTENFEIKRFIRATADHFRMSVRMAFVGSLSSPFMEFIGGAVGAFILYVGSRRVAEGHISPGDFGAFVMAVFMMYMPIKRLSKANNIIQQAVASHGRIREVLEAVPEIGDRPGAVPLTCIQGHVRFENVSFAYQTGHPVLTDLNFEIKPAETVALVGLSGAGKTTIISLLSRLYDPTQGRILVDGMDIRNVTLFSLRLRIGLVGQDVILFNDTVKNNIAYGLDGIPEDRILAAAHAARAHEFIMELPRQYDTVVGEKGGLLSAGQRQRLSIARALLKDPPILLLDEATSSLDAQSEHLIQEALAHLRQGRTTLIIAHRLSTVRSADRILVIESGRIVETGSHEELSSQNGLYRKLYELQLLRDVEDNS
jgi:ATP-binding cassette, subfamily B, bacterial MsbA